MLQRGDCEDCLSESLKVSVTALENTTDCVAVFRGGGVEAGQTIVKESTEVTKVEIRARWLPHYDVRGKNRATNYREPKETMLLSLRPGKVLKRNHGLVGYGRETDIGGQTSPTSIVRRVTAQ